jgi:hypothetical protein
VIDGVFERKQVETRRRQRFTNAQKWFEIDSGTQIVLLPGGAE